MPYSESSPPSALAPYVRLIWQYQSDADARDGARADADARAPLQRIVPDGHPELILHFGQPYAEVDAMGNVLAQAPALFAGQLTGPLLLQQAPGAGVLGVRFRPAGARVFFDTPMHRLRDQRVPLSKLWCARRVDDLHRGLLAAPDAEARVAYVSGALSVRLAESRAPADSKIAQCAEQLLMQQGLAMAAMAAYCTCSRRQFERRFLAEVGVSPRLLASIARFRTLFDALEQDSLRVRHWGEAAQMAGYFDQAHMNREFKRFAGLSPQAFCQALGGLSAAMVGAEVP